MQRHNAAITTLLILFRNGQNPLHVLLGHEDTGNGAGGGAQIHVDRAAGVVVNDHSLGPSIRRKTVLFRKGIGAPGDKDNLPCHIHPAEITLGHGKFSGVCGAGGISQEHKGIFRSLSIFVQAAPALEPLWRVACWGKRGVDLTHRHIGAGQTGIGNAGYRQSIFIRAGATDGVNVRVCRPMQICACGTLVTGTIGVARRNGHYNVGLRERLEQLLCKRHTRTGRIHKSRSVGAQAQIDGVAAQIDGVLDGSHVIIRVSAAIFAKHLHHQKLGLRGHATGQHRLGGGNKAASLADVPVGGGNAGHVGAMITLRVVVVGDVQVSVYIVVTKGHLGVAVEVRRREAIFRNGQPGQHLLDFLPVQQIPAPLLLTQGVVIGRRVKGGMVQIQAGVDDRNAHSGAGVPSFPGSVASHHVAGCDGHGRDLRLAGLVDRDGAHLLHAGQGRNLLHGPIGHHGGNGVGHGCELIAHLQGFLQHLSLNALNHRRLPVQETAGVGGRLRHGRGGIALLQGAFARQDDEHPDRRVRCRELLLLLFHCQGPVHQGGQLLPLLAGDLCQDPGAPRGVGLSGGQ